MFERAVHQFLNYMIAAVWLINGLICKMLNFVPRHQLIVATILGAGNAFLFTKLIGIAEIAMAIWFLTGIYRRLNVIIQMIVVAVMNVLEFFLAPSLLLWGKWNAFFALLFIGALFINEFCLNKPVTEAL